MINTLVALLVELELLTPEQGELMAQKIRQGTLPADYNSSARQVREWMREVKKETAGSL